MHQLLSSVRYNVILGWTIYIINYNLQLINQ